jgi:hypothetical protein
VSSKSKAKENFYLSDGKNPPKRRLSNVLSHSCSCKIGSTKRPSSDINLDLDDTFEDANIADIDTQTLKAGFKLRTYLHITNDGWC